MGMLSSRSRLIHLCHNASLGRGLLSFKKCVECIEHIQVGKKEGDIVGMDYADFRLEGQMVSILGFVGHTGSFPTTQLCLTV